MSSPSVQPVLWPTQLVTCVHWVPFIINSNYSFLVSSISPGVKRTWREAGHSSGSVPVIHRHFPIWLHGVELNKHRDNVKGKSVPLQARGAQRVPKLRDNGTGWW